MAFTYITLTGGDGYRYATGVAPSRVRVRARPLVEMTNGTKIPAKEVSIPFTAGGVATKDLAATTDPSTVPDGNAYRFNVEIDGHVVRSFLAEIPHDAAGGEIDLDDLVELETPPELAPEGTTFALADATDVAATTPTDGQVLTYDTGTGAWRPEAATGGTQVTVDGTPVSTLAIDSTPAVFNDLSDSGTLRTALFGGSARTQRAFFAARLSGNLSLTNNTTTLVPNGSLTIAKDTDSGWSSGSSTYTIPVNGFYRIRLFSAMAANATGSRYINVTLNSTTVTTGSIGEAAQAGSASYPAYQTVIIDARSLSATDVLRFYVYQDSGGALNLLSAQSGGVGAAITVEWLRPA